MKKILFLILSTLAILSCGKNEDIVNTEKEETSVLKVAATAIPAGEILETIKDDLKEEGVDLEIIIFNDYVQPNLVLKNKEVDANLFQHEPYMKNFGEQHDFEMVSVGKIYLPTLALYSKNINDISELKENDVILLPNDPTNLARSLILLDSAGIIKLSDNTKADATLEDIVENPKNIEFVELSADQLPVKLPEVAAGIVNSSFALNADLSYAEDGLIQENVDSPYANALVTLKGNENDERIQKLLKALQSDKVKKFLNEKYKDIIIPVF